MSLWHELNTPTQVVILTVGPALLAGAGYFGWQTFQGEPPEPAAVVETVTEAPSTEPAAAAALPKIDTWRVAQPDGRRGPVFDDRAGSARRVPPHVPPAPA